jgi:3-deoxy-D-manno-octulosonate 8-phosphate phosphatase (KDO 8-P phosphatase)
VAERARYVTRARGGHGAVREVVELLLKGQGRWEKILERYVAGETASAR